MQREWPFFATRISMLEMVFAKTDAALSAYYDARLVNESQRSIGVRLRAQLAADIATIRRITGGEVLIAEHPWIRESIHLRNVYTDPLNYLQAELLQRNRARSEEPLEQAIMVTIAGIAAGMRNTG